MNNDEARNPIFFEPEDKLPGEMFEIITDQVAPQIKPYYAVSNYGRVINIDTGKYMSPDYRNGYQYYPLRAYDTTNGKKNYSTNRLILSTFNPVPNMENLEAVYVNGNKNDNYVLKPTENGLKSNLKWLYPKNYGVEKVESTLEKPYINSELNMDKVREIRNLYSQGKSFEEIRRLGFDYLSSSTVANVCKNKVYKDPDYIIPKSKRFTDEDINNIISLHKKGLSNKDINDKYYPNSSQQAIGYVIKKHYK